MNNTSPAGWNFFRWMAVFLFALFLHFPVNASDPFVKVRLNHDVSFSIPRNWLVLSDSTRTTVDAYVATKGARLASNDLKFAANLYDDNRSVVAMTNVRFYPEQKVTQADIQGMTSADLLEADHYMREEMSKAGRLSGFSVLRWDGVKRISVNGAYVLAYGYRRSAMPQSAHRSPFHARYYRVLNGPRSFSLMVSYREDQEALIAPICDALLDSLTIK